MGSVDTAALEGVEISVSRALSSMLPTQVKTMAIFRNSLYKTHVYWLPFGSSFALIGVLQWSRG